MNQDVVNKIEKLCSFVCNGKTYEYEQKLIKATEHELYDAAIIYAWNIFMLFVYEKIWQIRELERLGEGEDFETDKIFLALTKNKPDNFFDGNLFSLNKLSGNKQGEDAIIGRLKNVYGGVDQQIFREVQQILQKRNTAAHLNSIILDLNNLEYVVSELLKAVLVIQDEHNNFLQEIFEHLEKNKQWYFSEQDLKYVNILLESEDVEKSKYMYISGLVLTQELSETSVLKIKENAIKYFINSNTFDDANSVAYDIISPMSSFLNASDVINILDGVFDRQSGRMYNQVLDASKIPEFFLDLYQLSFNNFPELQDTWNDFATKLTAEGYGDNFKQLIENIQLPVIDEGNV